MSTRLLTMAWILGTSATATAQDHTLHMAQAGALIDYAEFETRLLFNAVTARIFDPDITQSAAEELGRTLAAAKKSLDRADALLPESKAGASKGILKIRDNLVQAERQLQSFSGLLEAQIAALSGDESEEEEEGEEGPKADWNALRASAVWLAADVRKADRGHAALSKRLRIRLKPAPPPRGERP
jgi:hypothetical protein